MSLLKRTGAALLALALMLIGAARAQAPSDYNMNMPQALEPGHLYAEAALLVDMDSGETLLSKNARVRMYPASTTKIMTLLLALESDIGLDEIVTIPFDAADIPDGSSVIPVQPGDQMTFRDLLYGFMLSSGNDGANAVAVLVGGSIGSFVNRMNARAAELGCDATHYVNAHGYQDPEHYTTAQDLATLSLAAMKNADFRAIVAAPSWEMTIRRGDKTGKQTIESRNILLQSGSKYYYPYCVGIKTGHHRKAGWCFVGAAERDEMRLLCVALNCENEDEKWYDAARMFEYGYTRFERVSAQALLTRAAERFERVQIEGADPGDPEDGNLALDLTQVEGGEWTRPVLRDSEVALDAAATRLAMETQIEWLRPLTAPVAEGEALARLSCISPKGGALTAVLAAARAVAVPPTEAPTQAPTRVPEITATPEPVPEPPVGGMGVAKILWGLIALLLILLVVLAALLSARRRRRAKRRVGGRGRRARRR